MKNEEYGFLRAAACAFPVALGDPSANAKRMTECILRAAGEDVELLVFPELTMTGYTCADLFLREELWKQSLQSLKELLAATRLTTLIACVGMPLCKDGRLYNCAVYVQSGEVLGVVPKIYLPNYNEYYEKRWFVSGSYRSDDCIEILGKRVPFTEKLLLCDEEHHLCIGTEICEDLWVDSPPSGMLARAGATVIVNPSASNDVIGKREYRRDLVAMQSARLRAGYLYASAGLGESSTDLVFSGHCLMADNGQVVAEGRDEMVIGILDLERIAFDRRKFNSELWEQVPEATRVAVHIYHQKPVLPGSVDAYPFVPSDYHRRKERCMEILDLQSRGLMQRLSATGSTDVVVGISGGLDSTLALIVCVETFAKLQLPVTGIHAISMPGFGTSTLTKSIAEQLAEAFCVSYEEIPIRDACLQHFKDISHAEDVYDIAYENTQARERTQILFDRANMLNALVIGTGDMSELALGWCTYNGDHMSNYAVNCGVPKTLVKFIVGHYAESKETGEGAALAKTLQSVLDLPISPELLPTDADGNIAQKTESTIGKYDLHDFFLYHFIRNGFSREKLYALAQIAFAGQISDEEIAQTLDTFYRRFRTQQFKRSCIPDGVKVGSVSLSPRGDWRMPSDLSTLY